MTAKILDGRALSAIVKDNLKTEIAKLPSAPGLDVILVGDDPASEVYVSGKQKACKAVGIRSTLHKLSESTTEQALSDLIQKLNQDPNVHGILLQLPLPKSLDASKLLLQISAQKDVDGFHPYNLGRLMQRQPELRPCTPFGIINLLKHYQIELNGKHVVIVGASNIVGRPLAMELLLTKSTVTIAHRFSKNLASLVNQADILVSAIGKPGIIQSEWIKPGAVVVDVGITRLDNGKICGDIDFKSASKIASWITPVPGGVGPMTIATLLENTLKASRN